MLNLCGGQERESFIAKKFKSKIRVKAGPGAGGCPRPAPAPAPAPVAVARGADRAAARPGGRSGSLWSRLVGRPAGGRPGRRHRPADIKLGPCKRDKGNYWCGMPVQDG